MSPSGTEHHICNVFFFFFFFFVNPLISTKYSNHFSQKRNWNISKYLANKSVMLITLFITLFPPIPLLFLCSCAYTVKIKGFSYHNIWHQKVLQTHTMFKISLWNILVMFSYVIFIDREILQGRNLYWSHEYPTHLAHPWLHCEGSAPFKSILQAFDLEQQT